MDLFRRVRVKKPIDWANTWALEQQVKGISFEHDGQNNLKAWPVVIVDPSLPNIVPAGTTPEQVWTATSYISNATPVVVAHTAPAGQNSYVQGVYVDYLDVNRAVGAIGLVQWQNLGVVTQVLHGFWIEVNSSARTSFVLPFGPKARYFQGGVRISGGVADWLGGIYAGAWGYDA